MSPVSVHLDGLHESTAVNFSSQSSNMASKEGTASISLPTEPSDRKPDSSVLEASNTSTTPEKSEKSSVFVRSFRALGSMLGLSMISKSFKCKPNMCPEQNPPHRDAKDAGGEIEWADIVDNAVESDDGVESADSYIEFMRDSDTNRRRVETRGRKCAWDTTTKLEQQGEKDDVDDGNPEDDGSNYDTSESKTSIPWFSSNP